VSVALLFPGQGAQRPGMLETVPDTPAARIVVDQGCATSALLGVPTADLDDPQQRTVPTQLSLVVAGAACGRALIDDGGVRVSYVAGHSVGAFAAAVTAGVLTVSEAVAVVHARATSMQAVCASGGWGMAAVVGLPTRTVRVIAVAVSTSGDPVWVANVNSASQTVLGGTVGGLLVAEQHARHAGARSFQRVEVDIASHGPLQEPTARTVRSHLAGLPMRSPLMGYLTNSAGRATRSAPTILDDLAASVARPVQWYDCTQVMAELGVTCMVEAAPSHTLTRLASATQPGIAAISLSERRFDDTVTVAARYDKPTS
jgi:malonate decarboxylase epsilon subunit